jgi:hypothetical protein
MAVAPAAAKQPLNDGPAIAIGTAALEVTTPDGRQLVEHFRLEVFLYRTSPVRLLPYFLRMHGPKDRMVELVPYGQNFPTDRVDRRKFYPIFLAAREYTSDGRPADPANPLCEDGMVVLSSRLARTMTAQCRSAAKMTLRLTRAPAAIIEVQSAVYGDISEGLIAVVTDQLMEACNGRAHCSYRIDVSKLDDPAPKRRKEFFYTWRCGGLSASETISEGRIPPEASGHTARLDCAVPAAKRQFDK